MTLRDMTGFCAAASLALALTLGGARAEANHSSRSMGTSSDRCEAANAMAKKAMKKKAKAGAFTVLPHPSGRVAISARDERGTYTRTVVLRTGGSYTQLMNAQGAVIETFADGVPASQII